jgi:hypothetical protein
MSTRNAPEQEQLPFLQRPEVQDLFDTLAIGFGGMTLNPNQALIQSAQERIGARREERQTTAQRNATAAWLESQGLAQLAEGVRGGAISGAQALTMAQGGDAQLPANFRALDAQARAAGLQPNTPEYQEFMLYGGMQREKMPAGFESLNAQARAAGFVPRAEGGGGEYENFMATAGRGLSAEAAASGTARGQAASALSGARVVADRTLGLIDLVKKDPYLPNMVGPIEGRFLPNVSASAQRFQSRLDQLQGSAFLEAYNMLRGGGQITEIEGQKAENAMARLNTAQNEQDFLQALNEFEDAIRTGIKKLEAQAGMQPGGAPSPSGESPTDDPLGLRGGQ